MKLNNHRLLLLILLILPFLSGCNQKVKPDGMPDLYPCSITITQGGTPLEGALVKLEPKQGGTIAWNSDGRTDAKGIAKIATGIDFNGVPEGEYIVRVSKTELSPSELAEYAPKNPIEYDKWEKAKRAEKRITYNLVKPEFNDAKMAPHSITITKGKNEATFDVGEPIKEEIK